MKTFRLMSTLFFLFVLCLGIHAQQRLLGGDISLLPSYEEAGTVYRDEAGKAVAPLEYFKEEGWNAIRVRLFVEPDRASAEHKGEGVCQDLDYVMKLGQRIKKAGYQFMLDFHYSDTWADPGKQFMPYRWKNSGVASLPDSVYQYTRKSLEVMVKAGACPDLIQVGNEITNGMMWPAVKYVHGQRLLFIQRRRANGTRRNLIITICDSSIMMLSDLVIILCGTKRWEFLVLRSILSL